MIRTACGVVALALGLTLTGSANACTGIRLKAADGAVVYGRTVEFGVDVLSMGEILVLPRGTTLRGAAAGGRPGLVWTSKYLAGGAGLKGEMVLGDGVNEKGLAVGAFYHPGYAEYPKPDASDDVRSLGPFDFPTWLLTSFETVAEAKAALADVIVADAPFGPWGFTPPLHYVIHDAKGHCLVVEVTGGKLKHFDNPLGVITNSPTFDWHLTNLGNYVKLTPVNAPSLRIGGVETRGFGQGSGMLGLPGDYTPPSRFVRAVALASSALPGKDAAETAQQAFHVLANFDIPRGAIVAKEGNQVGYDITQYTVVSDTRHSRYYFHTYTDRRVRVVDIGRLKDLSEPLRIPLRGGEDILDITPRQP